MPLDLAIRVSVSPENLVIEYAVRNNTATDAYLLNRLSSPNGQISSNIAYVSLDRGRKIVRVGKYVADLPVDSSPTFPVAPFVTPLRGQSTFHETVTLPLPIREFEEYIAYAPSDGSELPVQYAGVQFTLGYYWSEPGVTERTVNGVVLPEGFKSFPQFGRLTSDVFAVSLPVIESAGLR